MSNLLTSETVHIRDVWSHNLREEFVSIANIVDEYPYVAMDTEFPGIAVRLLGNEKGSSQYSYHNMKANVDMLKLIQLGFTFANEQGILPKSDDDNKYSVWQFNFREFNPEQDVHASDSIELLSRSGIDFNKNNREGVDVRMFGELLTSSGVVLNDDMHWLTFHSGYDFAYLIKILSGTNLPETQEGFFEKLNVYFPRVYDLKHMMRYCNGLYGGLSRIAQTMGVERVGTSHQAGSDSLLTCCTFMNMKDTFFAGSLDKYTGVLFGLGDQYEQNTRG